MENNPFESARSQMHSAFSYIPAGYSHEFEVLLSPDRVIEIFIPVIMDDGSTRVFLGFRSEHNNARGPYKGGIRYHQEVTREEVMALSVWMSMKCAVLDLPLGGGKGGVIVDPKSLSKRELELLSRGWVEKLSRYLGPLHDVPAPDVNTNGEIMAWMVDEYSKLVGTWSPGSFTGKPLSIGGSLGRDTATAQGGFYILESYLKTLSQEIAGQKVIVQGAGNAGLTMMTLLHDAGAIIVGTSDSKTGVYDEKGLDIPQIQKIKLSEGSLETYSSGKKLHNAELILFPCDILIPAALENQITSENASSINTKLILELANGPTTPEADTILNSRGIPVIPDILANAGGVTVSYFEQVQNNTNYFWSQEEISTKLALKMSTALDHILYQAKGKGISLRTSAFIVALTRILEAMRARGV